MATKAQNLPFPVYLVYIFYSLLSSLYICRESSTNSPLFMQNKPNFRKARMNVSLAITRNYNNEQRTMNNERLCKTKPIKPNSRKARMDVSLAITRNYNNEQRTMNNERLCKTNPNKPNFSKNPAINYLIIIGHIPAI